MDAVSVWSALLDQLESDLDDLDGASNDACAMCELLASGVGMTPATPPVPMPRSLLQRSKDLHARYGRIEARLDEVRLQLLLELRTYDTAVVPRYIDAAF